jgi:hypothetical protein
MHVMILRMLSSGSLSAFSASVAASSLGQARPVQQVRGASAQPQSSSASSSQAAPQQGAGAATGTLPGRILPRGSLLDLSV